MINVNLPINDLHSSLKPPVSRNEVLDVAKGIAILLMPISHLLFFADSNQILTLNTYYLTPVKIPLFLIISGYLYSAKKPLEFAISKADSLLKPVVSIFLLTLIILLLFGGTLKESVELILQLYAPLWFVLFLFLSTALFNCFVSACRKLDLGWKVLIILGCTALSISCLASDINYIYGRFFRILFLFLLFLGIGRAVRLLDLFPKIISTWGLVTSLILTLACGKYALNHSIHVSMWHGRFNPFFPALAFTLGGAGIVL